MKVLPLLQDLKIGADAAEQDSYLDQYFIKTSTFYDIVADASDIVLGPKGSGKSAISRQLLKSRPAELSRVDVVPAFNLEGAVLFRRLANELDTAGEAALRLAWKAYILGLVGNDLLSRYPEHELAGTLRRAMETAGVLTPENQLRSVWSRVMDMARRLVRVEAGLAVNHDGMVSVTGAARLDSPTEVAGQRALIEQTDWERVLEMEVEILRTEGRRCWIIFDRLDEAFTESRDLERVALRALLRTHLDVCSYGDVIRTKLFLRTDLLDRITEDEGFVNATHLRIQRIQWDKPSIVDLIARRVGDSRTILRAFRIGKKQLNSPDGRNRVCGLTLAVGTESGGVDWLIARSVDASGEPNPRNVVTFCARRGPTSS